MSNKHQFLVPEINNLYSLSTKDFKRAREVLGQAFKEDPLWGAISKEDPELFFITFGMFLKYAFKYGKVYSLTNELNVIAIWVPSKYVSKTFYRLFRCGALSEVSKLIWKGSKLRNIFAELEKDQFEYTKNPCIYLNGLGVKPSEQGKGLGSSIVQLMIDHLPPGVPIYAETESVDNVRFYERLGFRVLKKIQLPVLDLPMWEMHFAGK